MKHVWNKWQKAAFACWGVGALLIVAPILYMYLRSGPRGATNIVIGMIMVGLVSLATGGTLHKIGTGREPEE